MTRSGPILLALAAAMVSPAIAQTSASFILQEHALNAGGRPVGGAVASSSSFRVTLDAIGDAALGTGLASTSFRLSGGFAGPRRPPGEVRGLLALADKQTFQWSYEPGSAAYNVYRNGLTALPGSFGTCAASRISLNAWTNADVPAAGAGLFYLVTGENLLWEEGTLGEKSDGGARPNTTPCP